MESDISDVNDEDKTSDTDEKVENSSPQLTVEPFQVVLKGGSPWGFTLKGGVEVRSPIQISEIKPEGKADVSASLRLGDYVLGVNDVKCVSLTEAVQLIQSAFRTLTLLVWRGSPKLEPNVSILRTSSFLQRARELQELERNRLGTQDDTILPKDTNNSTTLKSRQRRIESFHGTRRVKNNSSGSSGSNSTHSSPHNSNNKRQSPQPFNIQQQQSRQYSSPQQQSPQQQNRPEDQHGTVINDASQDVNGDNSEQDMESTTAAKLKGWATVGDLTQRQLLLQQQQQEQQQQQLQGQQVTTSAAPSNNVTPNQGQGHNQYPSGHLSPAMSSPNLNMADHWKSGYGHGSQSGNSHMGPAVTSVAMTKQGMDLHEGYATTSTPRSPTNSTNYMPKFPNRPTDLQYSKSGGGYADHYNKGSYSYNSRPSPHQSQHGSNMYTNDDTSVIKTPTSSSRKYERRSLPPQLNDYQNLNDLRTNPHSYGMLPPKEEEEGEDPSCKQSEGHSPSSPPPPPRRDMSSLKYVQASSSKNHEKYPSWPVTHPNMDIEAGEAITSQMGAWPVRDKPIQSEAPTGDNKTYKPQLKPVNEGLNDSDRKNGEDNKRNQSDPGFNKPNSFKGLSIKRPTPQEIQQSWNQSQKISTKPSKSVDNFLLNNSPGYPKPLLDQDGNRIGDAKYIIPSPPERDTPAPDTKLLQEKLASMMAPNTESSGLRRGCGTYLNFDPSRVSDSMQQSIDTQGKGHYSPVSGHPASTSQSASLSSVQTRVDSSTSPLQSPMEANQPLFGNSPAMSESKDRPSESLQQVTTPRGVIVKHMLYYNTGTQTDTSSSTSQTSVHVTKHDKDSVVQEKSIQAHLSDKEPRIETSRSVSSNFGTKYVQGLNDSTRKSRNSSETKDSYSEEDSQNYAPMIRKLSQEYMSGRMQGIDKRASGDSGIFTVSATSPGSDMPPHSFGHFPGMREAESCNSVVIHPNETSHPFGKDYQDLDHEGRIDLNKMELDRRLLSPSESRVSGHKGRYSMDPTYSQKILPNKKSIQDTRYGSEANLQATYANQRMHSMSMSSLAPKHSKADSFSDRQYLRPTHKSSNSSSSSRHGSDHRSSTSSYQGSISSPITPVSQGQGQQRTSQYESDSVFLDSDVTTSPNVKQPEVSSPKVSQSQDSGSAPPQRSIGRNTSMKLAYGTYDEASRKHDDAGPKPPGRLIAHGKSQSYSDYMQMNNNTNRTSLGQIREDSSEGRWASVVNKSRSLHQNTTSSVSEESNYANIDPLKMEKTINPELIERSNLKRTASEQIRPLSGHGFDEIRPPLPNRDSRSSYHSAMKHSKSDTWQKPVQSPTQSQSDLHTQNFQSPSTSQMDLNPDSDTEVKTISSSVTNSAISSSLSQSQKDQNRRSDDYMKEKQKQRDAVQDFMERKTGKRPSDSDDVTPTTPEDPKIVHSSPQDRSSPKLTPTQSFREKYARRQESLRRSKSITSRDSSDYVHMSRPTQPHPQTEWSKIRSQAQDGSKRPHSISSDISLVDPYAVTPITEASKQQDMDMEVHKRSKSDSTDVAPQDQSPQVSEVAATSTGGSLSGSSLDYANVGYRRPPPPPPVEDDKPPALPPRNYRHASASQLDVGSHGSQSVGYLEPLHRGAPETQVRKPRESSPESYAQQLRIQYRRFSEQNLKPTTMSVVSSRTVTHCSQSQKRSSLTPQEATPPTTMSSLVSSTGSMPPHQMSYATTTNHLLMSQAPSANQTMTNSHVGPVLQSSPRSSVSHISTPVSLALHVTPSKENANLPQTASSQNYSPPMQLCSPELPPPPTPIKNPEDLAAIQDLDLPAPPPEVLSHSGESSLEGDDRCADDSYGSHKTRSARQVGVYNRSKSTTLLTENNNYKQQIQKPPRRHLNNQGWRSENAINMPPLDLDDKVVDAEFVTAESTVTPIISSRPLGNSQSTSSIMAPRPFMTTDHSRHSEVVSSEKDDSDSPSVKDRIFRFEKKPSNGAGDNKLRKSPSSVNNLKKSFEDRTKPSDNGTDTPRQGNQYSSKYKSRYESRQEMAKQGSRSARDHHSSGSDKSDHSVPFTVEKKRMNYLGQYGVQGNGYSQQHHDSSGALQRNSDSSENVYRPDLNSYNQTTPDRVGHNRPERPEISPNPRLEASPHLPDRYESDPTPPKVPQRSPLSHRPVPQPEAPSPIDRSAGSYGHHKSNSSSSDISEGYNTSISISHERQPSQEELDCNEKVQEFARQVKDKDKKLSEMLNQDDLGRMKFMSGIVPPPDTPRKHSSGHSPQVSKLSTGSNEDAKDSTPNGVHDNSTDQNSFGRSKEKGSPPSNYWVSPSKAQIEIDIRNSEELGKKMTEDIVDPESLIRTKEELVSSIVKKMDKLKDEKSGLQIEIKEVDNMGKTVSDTVEQKCKSQKEKDKFQTFLKEMDHIIRLLLKVSGLLARAENALQGLPEDCDVHQKDIATQKRDRYKAQHEEAQKLKQDIDQRSTQILGILRESLSDQELEDYQYYIKMKSRLTVEHQNLEDKITLGQEQIQALRRSIPDKRH